MRPSGSRRDWAEYEVVKRMLEPIRLPKMARVRQDFEDGRITDIPASIAKELAKPRIAGTIKAGMRVAITAGSRGIANISLIIGELVRQVRRAGAHPFVIPAMGSHGGATAVGQRDLLAELGIIESSIGAPILATMETRVLGRTEDGRPVHIDRFAAEADGIIVVGRIKPHSDFRGDYESGLMKMMAVGMGKHAGAEICHFDGFGSMAHNIATFGRAVLESGKVLFGLAIVENAFHATRLLEAIHRDEILSRERELLAMARSLMPCIPLRDFDILIVDRIGKNFSGEGADPCVTGVFASPHMCSDMKMQRYVVLDVSEETRGNSIGMGMADFTTQRVLDKTDFDAVYTNAITSRLLETARVPIVMADDRDAIRAAIYSCVGIDLSNPRLVRISNSSDLDIICLSEALLDDASSHPRLRVLEEPCPLSFDSEGNLPRIERPGA